MILHWLSFRIFSFDNCVDDTPTETGLTVTCYMLLLHATPRLTPGRLPAPSCANLGVAPPETRPEAASFNSRCRPL